MDRKTVNLSDEDRSALAPYLDRGSPEQLRLAERVGEPEASYLSESAALRALALVGAKALREQLMSEGYHALANSYADEDEAFETFAVEAAERSWLDRA